MSCVDDPAPIAWILREAIPDPSPGRACARWTTSGLTVLIGQPRLDPGLLAAVENIQGWTRARFKLAAGAVVLVSEVACQVPLCPPLETAVAFWTDDGQRHQFRLYKPLHDVIYDDIGWLMGPASGHQGGAWDCC